MFVSLHADPKTDFPFYWVHADECGEGEGEGSTLNFPLPRGTAVGAHRKEHAKALPATAAFEPEILLVSFGADTFADDHISFFEMQTADHLVIANEIKALELPTAIVMEGGYAVGELG